MTLNIFSKICVAHSVNQCFQNDRRLMLENDLKRELHQWTVTEQSRLSSVTRFQVLHCS